MRAKRPGRDASDFHRFLQGVKKKIPLLTAYFKIPCSSKNISPVKNSSRGMPRKVAGSTAVLVQRNGFSKDPKSQGFLLAGNLRGDGANISTLRRQPAGARPVTQLTADCWVG